MSHAQGTVYTKNGKVIGYFEYNGTGDFALTAIQKTLAELLEYWRTDEANRKCICGGKQTDVVLYADYGDGYHWDAKICEKCMAITSGQDPYEEDKGGNYLHEPISGEPFPTKTTPPAPHLARERSA